MNRTVLLIAVLASACAVEESSSGPQLLVPDEVVVDWDDSLDEVDDGLVALVPVDVMVYDSQSGDPLGGTELELVGNAPEVLLLDADDVLPLSSLQDESDKRVAWDAWRDRYVVLGDQGGSDRLLVSTDETGLARVYVLVDRFGFEGSPASVTVSTAEIEQALVLRPR